MSQPVVVRPVRPGDADALRGIFNWAVANTDAIMAYDPRTPEEQADWMARHDWAEYPALVATHPEDGAVLGYASLSNFIPRPGYARTAEVSSYVHPDWHGLGIGNALLTALCREADARGFVSLLAFITSTNEPSLRLYARHGFTPAGVLRRAGFKFDHWINVTILERVRIPEGDG
jgi:L-amino acid N-acyltransferase